MQSPSTKRSSTRSSKNATPSEQPAFTLREFKMLDEKCRNYIVRCGKFLNSDRICSAFGRVYINKDLSYFRRQEEKRLRMKRNELKASYPEADVRLKSGKLYLSPAIKDIIDYKNQLFWFVDRCRSEICGDITHKKIWLKYYNFLSIHYVDYFQECISKHHFNSLIHSTLLENEESYVYFHHTKNAKSFSSLPVMYFNARSLSNKVVLLQNILLNISRKS